MSAPAPKRRTCRHRPCGKKFTPNPRTPGQSYCTSACRQKAGRTGFNQRDAVRPPKTGSDLRKGTPRGVHPLGIKEQSFPRALTSNDGGRPAPEPEASETAEEERGRRSRERRSRRYANRRTLWAITDNAACRGCGRAVMDPDSGVILARTAEGNAVALGLLRCGRIWLCPVCSAKVRHGRAEELSRAAVEWLGRGGAAYLVTFTVRHSGTHDLRGLLSAIQGCEVDGKRKPGAYQRLLADPAFYGRSESTSWWQRKDGSFGHSVRAAEEGIRHRIGYIGMIRATEVTRSPVNGWHPHIHALVFCGGSVKGTPAKGEVVGVFDPPEEALAEWQDHWRAVWTRTVRRIDPEYTPDDRIGVDFKRVATIADVADLGTYIAKTQDGKAPANEVMRGDLKIGRQGSVTPFQILGRIGDLMGGVDPETLDGFGDLRELRAWWAEYESATAGRRAIEWTRGLRGHIGIEGDDSEESDLDLLFEAESASEFRAGVGVDAQAWHKIAGRALDLAATEAVEAGRLGDVADLVTAAGGSAGAVRILTPGEITEAYEGLLAKLADRRDAAAARRGIAQSGADVTPTRATPNSPAFRSRSPEADE